MEQQTQIPKATDEITDIQKLSAIGDSVSELIDKLPEMTTVKGSQAVLELRESAMALYKLVTQKIKEL